MPDRSMALLSLPELRQRFGVGRSTIYRWIATGGFPRPIKLSDSVNRWRESDVETWLAKKAPTLDAAS